MDALRHVSDSADRVSNHRAAVDAAILVDDLVQLLRGEESGRAIILGMLTAAYPRSVPAREMRYASGIQEFARRVRELRQEGYDIASDGESYRLVSFSKRDSQIREGTVDET